MGLKTRDILTKKFSFQSYKTDTKAFGKKTDTNSEKNIFDKRFSVRFALKSPEIESLSTTLKASPDVRIQLAFSQISKLVLLVYDLN